MIGAVAEIVQGYRTASTILITGMGMGNERGMFRYGMGSGSLYEDAPKIKTLYTPPASMQLQRVPSKKLSPIQGHPTNKDAQSFPVGVRNRRVPLQ